MEFHHRKRCRFFPVVANGNVYVGSFDNVTYALNANTGALVWKVTTGYDQCVQASPAFANGVIYTGGAFDKKVNALDTATGTEKWTYTLDEGLTTAPAIIGNTIYVTSTLGNKTYDLNQNHAISYGASKQEATSTLHPL
jgi:outer membrane protein assembly factor BamB